MSAAAIMGSVVVLILSIAAMGSRQFWVAVFVPVAGAIAAFWLYRLGRRIEAEEHSAAQGRPAELETQLSAQRELAVYGSTQLLFGIGGLFAGAVLVFWGTANGHLFVTAGAIVVLAGALVFLLLRLPSLGQPRIVLTPAGFRLPHAPLVPWSLVEGIWLEQVRDGNVVTQLTLFYRLIFYIPSLPERIRDFPWFMKISYRFRTPKAKKRLRVVLGGASEHPEAVYHLCRRLWTKNTGLDYPWFPDMTDEAAAAYRQVDLTLARMNELKAQGADPMESARASEALDGTDVAMREDLELREKRLRWMIVAALIALVATSAFSLYATLR